MTGGLRKAGFAWLAALLMVPGAMAQHEPTVPPTGQYLEPRSGALFHYDNQTGLLAPTGELTAARCVGIAEQRTFGAGICVDVDAMGSRGIDAASQVTLVGEWFITSTLEVGGRTYGYCQPACFIDVVPGITYESWKARYNDVCHALDGAQAAVVATDAWEPGTGIRLSAVDTATIVCPHD